MSVSLVVGIIGMLMILGAFVLVGNHRLSPDDLLYDALNAVGSVLLVISAVITHGWPFVVLNTVWGLYALRDVIVRLRKDVKVKRSISKDLISPLVHKHSSLKR